MNLKPQDIIVLLKIISLDDNDWSYSRLGKDLHMSSSEVHAGIKRCENAKLFNPILKKPIKRSLCEFLVHGIKYAFPAIEGGPVRGIPTAYASPAMKKHINVSENNMLPVWPCKQGKVKGFGLSPLFKSVPHAVLNDPKLYKLLSIVDSIRYGKAREYKIAIKLIEEEIYNEVA